MVVYKKEIKVVVVVEVLKECLVSAAAVAATAERKESSRRVRYKTLQLH